MGFFLMSFSDETSIHNQTKGHEVKGQLAWGDMHAHVHAHGVYGGIKYTLQKVWLRKFYRTLDEQTTFVST